jgi:hypothetical protein
MTGIAEQAIHPEPGLGRTPSSPMTLKPRLWFPIAAALSALNLGAVWFAAQPGEPWHATIHAGLALGFGLWAQHLRRRLRQGASLPPAALHDVLDEVEGLRQELNEAQERLDFAERMLAQRPHHLKP